MENKIDPTNVTLKKEGLFIGYMIAISKGLQLRSGLLLYN